MTFPIDALTLAVLREVQESTMGDECEVWRMTPGALDEYGKERETWAAVWAGKCGVRYPAHGRDLDKTGAEVQNRKGKIRLPHGTEVRHGDGAKVLHSDRVKVTRRWGVPIDPPLVFEVAEAPGIGPTGVELVVELVTDGTAGTA